MIKYCPRKRTKGCKINSKIIIRKKRKALKKASLRISRDKAKRL